MKYTLEERLKIFKERGYSYNSETGRICDKIDSHGYIQMKTSHNVHMRANIFAWYMYYGEIPKMKVDHINRIRTDNKISNLRLLSQMENTQNSEHLGYFKQNNKFRVQICVNYKKTHIGYFNTEEEAKNAYLEAKKLYHPSYKN